MKKITYLPSSINFLLYLQLFVVQARQMVNYTKKIATLSLPPQTPTYRITVKDKDYTIDWLEVTAYQGY
ncbi:hypothetical protein D3C73_1456490 [compost metagenome]